MKKNEVIDVPSVRWTGVVAHFVDADESDPTEDRVATADKVATEEGSPLLTEETDVAINPLLCRNMRMSTEPGYLEEPALSSREAKDYTRSAVPAFRGMMCLNTLHISKFA